MFCHHPVRRNPTVGNRDSVSKITVDSAIETNPKLEQGILLFERQTQYVLC